jgi:hypothetical protein
MILKQLSCKSSALSNFIDTSELLDSYNIKHWFDLSDDTIHYKLINETENKTYIDVKISLSMLKSNKNFADQTMWSVSNDACISKVGVLTNEDLVAPMALSLLTKNNTLISEEYSTTTSPFRFFVPGKNSPVEQFIFMVKVPTSGDDNFCNVNVSFDGPAYNDETAQSLISWKNLIEVPTTQFTVNDSTINVVTTVTDTNITELFLEPIVGSLDRTRISLVNGTGYFNISTASLNSGDRVRVKLGYKYFTGATEFTTTV